MTDTGQKHGRFQFTLQTLLVVVLFVSLPLSCVGIMRKQFADTRKREAHQRQIAAELSEFDPVISIDAEADLLTGRRWSFSISGLTFHSPNIGQLTDDHLARLNELDKLKHLDFSSSGVTDDGLVHLAELDFLVVLVLSDTSITDAGVERLKGLPRLVRLDLVNTRITDGALAHLHEFRCLESLSIPGTDITDEGLEHFRQLPRLRYLDVRSTKVTPEGVKELQKTIPECEILYDSNHAR